ncbi:hypothetical protein O181_060339 [Austropuccinia psidii MF-1]|uniref:PUB domain-containing protein n=1 Tax=Austropuccinia psidii MF-1 TaxID=1389203 RepID=A0A9Q3EG61_9BASI|nr:hypothetical protein [Austropuccinia psidii MF-1]
MSFDNLTTWDVGSHVLGPSTSMEDSSHQSLSDPLRSPDRAVTLHAALQRQSLSSSVAPDQPDCLQKILRQRFLAVLDDKIIPKNSAPIVLASLQIMLTIISNVLKYPEEHKYKSLKLTNPLIKKNVVDVQGAESYLQACKFGPVTKEHLGYLCFPHNPSKQILDVLTLGQEVLKQRLDQRSEAFEIEKRMVQKEREEEKMRKARALENIKEDREKQKQRQLPYEVNCTIDERNSELLGREQDCSHVLDSADMHELAEGFSVKSSSKRFWLVHYQYFFCLATLC